MKTAKFAAFGLVLSAATLLAQRPFGVLTNTPPDPATIVQNRVARLTQLLGLNSSQAAQATTIFTNAQTALTPAESMLSQARKALPTAVKANDTATIDQLAQTMGGATAQITSIQNRADAAFYAILDPGQQSKLGQGGGWGMRGMGPRGRGPGHP